MDLIVRDGIFYIIGSVCDEDAPALREIKNSKQKTVILDLSDCTRLGSLSIGVIVQAHKKLSKEGKKIILKNPKPNIKEILISLKLDTIIEIS